MAKGFEEEKGGRTPPGEPLSAKATGARSGTAALRPAKVRVGPGGRIVIPAAFRDALGIAEGDTLILSPEADGSVRLLTSRAALRRAQEIFRKYVPEGSNVVDEFLAERRAMWGEE